MVQNYLADNVSREEMKREAVKRMAMFRINPLIIGRFIEEDCVFQSESPTGSLSKISDEQKKRIQKFEKNRKALVYYVMCSNHGFGRVEDYLFVDRYRPDWKWDCEDIKAGYIYVYSNNLDIPDYSELGCINVECTPSGVLIREFFDCFGTAQFEQKEAVFELLSQIKNSIHLSEREVAPTVFINGTEDGIEYTVY